MHHHGSGPREGEERSSHSRYTTSAEKVDKTTDGDGHALFYETRAVATKRALRAVGEPDVELASVIRRI